MYPENIDYLHKTITRVLKFNKENSHLFTSNENLCSFVLCDSNSMLCINQKCEDAKDFSKLMQYNAAFFSSLNAVRFYFKNGADCTDHKVKCLQYERALNDHKGATKKKIQLANKFFTLPELIELLKI